MSCLRYHWKSLVRPRYKVSHTLVLAWRNFIQLSIQNIGTVGILEDAYNNNSVALFEIQKSILLLLKQKESIDFSWHQSRRFRSKVVTTKEAKVLFTQVYLERYHHPQLIYWQSFVKMTIIWENYSSKCQLIIRLQVDSISEFGVEVCLQVTHDGPKQRW